MVDVNEYTREVTCEYKGELYSVRDNGAVMRHIREGKKARKLDNVWTFGNKNAQNGYMLLNQHRVHIIVAKAFIPGNEDGKMVVDHIDTNRCNNRVENLRWLTRLENVLLNEATLKRVTYLCGGDINKFIGNPSCLRDLTGDNQDIMWMRTVTAEEAKLAWERISTWAKRPSSTFKMSQKHEEIKDFDEWLKVHDTKEPEAFANVEGSACKEKEKKRNIIDDWKPKTEVFTRLDPGLDEEANRERKEWEAKEAFAASINESLTPGAWQKGFYEKLSFPLCPCNSTEGLDAYARNLEIGKTIACSEGGDEYIIESLGWTCEWDAIQVGIKMNERDIYFCIHIRYEDGKFVHCQGTFKAEFRFCDSPNVLQCGAKAQCSFPLCPKEGRITLEEYAKILQEGAMFEKSPYSDGYIYDREITKADDGTEILYIGVKMPDSFKMYADMIVFAENGKMIHQLGRTFFDKRFLERKFCHMRGQEWKDEEVIIDDYC